ncbi:hypothetical protein AGLY_003357 [Aphis glycines]|uniref:Mutator-like transposase domain-containing protein n=1 Tax=Aphis glycines TaxID=307491 RepID=A0A6G0U2P1_APHGL|nr:hypothetical protein AGLY_003357 [Aphis glycines]
MACAHLGLQTRIKNKCPLARFIPCSAHSLNLIGECEVDSCKDAKMLEDCNEKSIKRCEAKGLLIKLNSLETALMATLWGEIMERFDSTSKPLQLVNIDLATVVSLYKALVLYPITAFQSTTSSISTDTNIHGKWNYSLTDDDISLATPLDTGYQNLLLDMTYHLQPSSSSPINKEVNVSSSLFSTVLDISPINKSEILSIKDQSQYEEYPNLCTSNSPAKNNTEEIEVCGRRIVNIFNLFEEIKNIDNHEPFDCSFKNMIVIGEKRIGFKSIFTFKCSMCQIKKTVDTENNVFMPINTSTVLRVLNIGCGYSQLQEVMSAVEVPTIHIKT